MSWENTNMIYKYSKEYGAVLNTELESALPKNDPRWNTQRPSVQYTIDAVEYAGGIRATAEALGTSTQGVRYWCQSAEHGVGHQHVVSLSKLTHGKITPEQLRPDIFKD